MQSRVQRTQNINKRIQTEWQTYFMKQVEFIHKSGVNTQPFLMSISKNPDFDFDYVTAHPEYNWPYNSMAMNPNLPLDFIIKNIDNFKLILSNWEYIFCFNNNLTHEFLIDLYVKHNVQLNIIKLMERGFFNTKELLSKLKINDDLYVAANLLLNDYTFEDAFTLYLNAVKLLKTKSENILEHFVVNLRKILCMRPDFDFTYLDKYKDEPELFDWQQLTLHPNLTLDTVSKHINAMWVHADIFVNELEPYYKTCKPTCLSNNPCITIDFIREHMNFNWDWLELTKTIHPQIIKDNLEFPWVLNKLSENAKLTAEFVLNNKFFTWDLYLLINRFYDNCDFVTYFIKMNKYSLPNEHINLMQQPIQKLFTTDTMINKNIFIFDKYIIEYLKHKFFAQEYRKHIAAYLIQQRWMAVYMSPYNPIGHKKLCRDYDQYVQSITQKNKVDLL